MTTSAKPSGSSNPTGHFMLTLCQLAAPVSIRPPQSPQLKPFTFFTSRAPQPDGSERFSLHMGYFETLADAESWLVVVRRRYPAAFATIRPADDSLTDTQVLRILEARRVTAVRDDVDERNYDQIAMLRPDDTGTRRALKEAVAQGAPVSFAVQLHWSVQPIDLSSVPLLAVFKPHTLYATESRRQGHSCYFLRLGFFADPISAKQVAVQVRSTFASAAVVPVVEQEVARARDAGRGTAAIPYLGEPLREAPGRDSLDAEVAAQTPEPVARKGTMSEADSLSESGVRHLRIEVQEQSSGRWKIVRLGAATPSNMAHV